ncbi:unnamed protein product [Orchesella dallaii]|uniref:Uncharacterized protein n=1 Tax=Orchesella dallaii TaxID=48710 RepID=A0ABP1QY86_9HEXA
MENYHGIVLETERILSLFQENMSLLQRLNKLGDEFITEWKQSGNIRLPQDGLSNPHPVFKEMRKRYFEILNKEKNINPKYSEFSNELNEAIKRYEYVGNALHPFLGRDAVTLRLLKEREILHLRKLLTEDEKFAEFRDINVSELFEKWSSLNLVQELREYVDKMQLLKMEMTSKLHAMENDWGVRNDLFT